MADISGLNNLTAEVGRASDQVLNDIKNHAREIQYTLSSEHVKGSSETSDTAKGFSQEAVSVSISDNNKDGGNVYTPPK